ncbi:hypothetical protein LAZ67_18002327 [Cordylochernes scorpioides]|uniref:Protein quiver n=1 Tax=Cordylochernes scorpioides TaxID=51811 RepID=A0ABY6LGH9_9ARAC|nr:hypothetical protein LAZ67_18002327 [Cordylochernes scorpioides]
MISTSYIQILQLCWVKGWAWIWCYSCVSSEPGCGHELDWRIHHAKTCPRPDDKCVKLIETRGAEMLITRDCVSNLEIHRRDLPADRYEGCRPGAKEPKRAVYVENDIVQLEIKHTSCLSLRFHRDYWTNKTFCFCEFDHWCNGGSRYAAQGGLVTVALVLLRLLMG